MTSGFGKIVCWLEAKCLCDVNVKYSDLVLLDVPTRYDVSFDLLEYSIIYYNFLYFTRIFYDLLEYSRIQ